MFPDDLQVPNSHTLDEWAKDTFVKINLFIRLRNWRMLDDELDVLTTRLNDSGMLEENVGTLKLYLSNVMKNLSEALKLSNPTQRNEAAAAAYVSVANKLIRIYAVVFSHGVEGVKETLENFFTPDEVDWMNGFEVLTPQDRYAKIILLLGQLCRGNVEEGQLVAVLNLLTLMRTWLIQDVGGQSISPERDMKTEALIFLNLEGELGLLVKEYDWERAQMAVEKATSKLDAIMASLPQESTIEPIRLRSARGRMAKLASTLVDLDIANNLHTFAHQDIIDFLNSFYLLWLKVLVIPTFTAESYEEITIGMLQRPASKEDFHKVLQTAKESGANLPSLHPIHIKLFIGETMKKLWNSVDYATIYQLSTEIIFCSFGYLIYENGLGESYDSQDHYAEY